jgi:hypothetical protein
MGLITTGVQNAIQADQVTGGKRFHYSPLKRKVDGFQFV